MALRTLEKKGEKGEKKTEGSNIITWGLTVIRKDVRSGKKTKTSAKRLHYKESGRRRARLEREATRKETSIKRQTRSRGRTVSTRREN